MKAIVNTALNQLEIKILPTPQPGPGQVRIRTGACGICATDILMIAGWAGMTPPRTGFPSIPGHEWAGAVDATGEEVDVNLIGQHCVAENVLSDGGEVGFEHPGGYSQYFLTDAANLQPLPADFPLAHAVLIEPLAVCVRAMKRLRLLSLDPEIPSRLLILGDGPIGLLLVMLARHIGVQQIILAGGRSGRLALAEALGAAQTINYHLIKGELAAGIRKAAGQDFPAIFEASGAGAAMQACLELARVGCRIGVLGDYGAARADFPWNHLLHREIELIGSNASALAWPEAVRLAVGGSLPLGKLISHQLPAEQFQEGIALTRGKGDVVKVVLEW